MKNLSKIFNGFMILFMLVILLSCNNDDDGTPMQPVSNTVTYFVSNVGADYTLLLEAVVKANLATTLSRAGPFTVFAPNNAAFEIYLNGATIADVSAEDLTDLLLNHVVSGDVRATDLTTTYYNTLSTATPNGAVMV